MLNRTTRKWIVQFKGMFLDLVYYDVSLTADDVRCHYSAVYGVKNIVIVSAPSIG